MLRNNGRHRLPHRAPARSGAALQPDAAPLWGATGFRLVSPVPLKRGPEGWRNWSKCRGGFGSRGLR
jgi:hypothetical protein